MRNSSDRVRGRDETNDRDLNGGGLRRRLQGRDYDDELKKKKIIIKIKNQKSRRMVILFYFVRFTQSNTDYIYVVQ